MTIVVEIFNTVIVTEISTDELALVMLIVPSLFPPLVCSADNSAFRHDYEWTRDFKFSRELFSAKSRFIARWFRRFGTEQFWVKPLDSIVVGGVGVLLFTEMNYGILRMTGGLGL